MELSSKLVSTVLPEFHRVASFRGKPLKTISVPEHLIIHVCECKITQTALIKTNRRTLWSSESIINMPGCATENIYY